MTRRRRTLGEELADLANPAPIEYDPESSVPDGLFSSSKNATETAEFDDDNDDADREHYVDVGRGRLRSVHVSDLPAYVGKRASRAELFEEDDEEKEKSDEGEEGGTSSDEQDDEYGSAASHRTAKSMLQGKAFNHPVDENDDGADSDSDTDETKSVKEYDSGDGENSHDGIGIFLNGESKPSVKIQSAIKSLEQEEKALVASLSHAAQQDIEKGRHVRNQRTIWDALLDCRIRLQGGLAAVNQFPNHEDLHKFVEYSDDVKKQHSKTSTSLIELLDDFISLRRDLMSNIESITLPPHRPSKDLTSIHTNLSTLDIAFQSYRDNTLDKWSTKIQSAHLATATSKTFKAINTSATSQIKAVLSDKERVLKRTRLRRSDGRVLGKRKRDVNGMEAGEERDEYDVEIFDDGDFYRQQLRELVESRVADADDPLTATSKWSDLNSFHLHQKRKKKNVDRRASKGRKIRTDVHAKLVGFMPAQPNGTWSLDKARELFKGLFGANVGASASADIVEDIGTAQGGSELNANIMTTDGLRLLA
ncbi:hypothetical protein SeMB42_g05802 [Synchytrium endobioticum]|uniref:Protein BFR2 n=1 Tax=Synchytrium endobioticum TaxID=286115 RepID=A0A507CPB1_9FUNG|nr:hypothetical protein SeMB42_g05802 [Synchytrium endobioticum]TPX46288.1 hypothetical protein SeLEV6574_g03301 [Synchytrium endobioticum]